MPTLESYGPCRVLSTGSTADTPREQQVAQFVIYGMSDTEISKRLGISTHTVRDHLKKVFDKTGTNSRGRLLHILYFTHYRPDIEAGCVMGTRGWFTTSSSDPAQALR
ncbi:helix-turn-helix transcriptional regulator [Streptomyces sp. NBC_01367]|uniref:helix-turn-helix transcriptional regulator n=1 Tax=Streptomyces sp. NBC_01367 TaxID=2903841 RepID=UPI00324FF637